MVAEQLATVPLIDVGRSPLLAKQSSTIDLHEIALEIDQACTEIGFLVIKGHGVDPKLIADVQRISLEYFRLPYEEKMRLKTPEDRYRGYVPPATEGLAASLDNPTPPDMRESFNFGPFDHPLDDYHCGPEGKRYFAPNVWPEIVPSHMQETFERYYAEMEALSDYIMELFALALGVEQDWFKDKIDKQIANCSVIFYPGQGDTHPLPGQLRAGAHTDYGSLTIVHTNSDVGGLQVLDKASGNWVGVPCIPDTFVVNLGDLMSDWTNHRWVSNLHRVVNPPHDNPNAEKLSMVFFHQPNYDAVIECLPTCCSADNPPQHGRVTSGEHITRKITKQRKNAAVADEDSTSTDSPRSAIPA